MKIKPIFMIIVIILLTLTSCSLFHKHNYQETIINPTCMERGYTLYKCECGHQYESHFKDLILHSYGEWELIKDSSIYEEGSKKRVCIFCEKEEFMIIPKLDHEHNFVEKVYQANCEHKGYTEYKCQCGYSYRDNFTEQLEHTYVNGYCSKCNYKNPNYFPTPIVGEEYELGSYPQTVVSDENIIKELNKIERLNSRGYIEFNGEEYAKVEVVTRLNYDRYFSDGTKVINGKIYYFKVEPIKWLVVSSNNGSYKLITKNIMDYKVFYQGVSYRQVNGESVKPNNYEYSNIRAWLNGYDGSKYNVANYQNKGMYDLAFSLYEKELIQKVLVDNSATTTSKEENKYSCNNTYDKLYLLSYQDVFSSNLVFYNNRDRMKKTTDYAIGKGIGNYNVKNDTYKGNSYWYLRSPSWANDNTISCVDYKGENCSVDIVFINMGVYCGITIKI